MNVQETLQILQALQACGATHFKSQDFEIAIGANRLIQKIEQVVNPGPIEPTPQPVPVENAEATERLKNLISTLNLPPEQLLDRIFPAGAGD